MKRPLLLSRKTARESRAFRCNFRGGAGGKELSVYALHYTDARSGNVTLKVAVRGNWAFLIPVIASNAREY